MDTDDNEITAIETSPEIRAGWKHLLMAATGISAFNILVYLAVKRLDPLTCFINIFFVAAAAIAQVCLTGPKLFGLEGDKMRLVTDRRRAQLFGISFRENMKFPGFWDILGGAEGLIRLIVIVTILIGTSWFSDVLRLNPVAIVTGFLIAFALLPDWLWAPILASAGFMVVGAHSAFGPHNIVTMAAVCVCGVEILLFAWYIANLQDGTRFGPTRRRLNRNLTQIVQLSAAFLTMAIAIFFVLPKDMKYFPKTGQQVNKQEKTQIVVSQAPGGPADGASGGGGGGGGKPAPPQQSGNVRQQGKGSGKPTTGQDQAGGPPGSIKINVTTAPGQETPGSDQSEASAAGKGQGSGQGSGKGSGQGSGQGAGKGDGTGDAQNKQGKGSGNGAGVRTEVQQGKAVPAQKTVKKEIEKKPVKPRPEPKRQTWKNILIVAIAALLIALVILIVKQLSKQKKTKSDRQKTPKKTPQELAAAVRTFDHECRRIVASAGDSEEDRKRLIIHLYNLLMKLYDECGIPKPEHFTPDEFDRNEFTYRPAARKALNFVTILFNQTYYGRRTPGTQELRTYQQAVTHLGNFLANMARQTA